MNEKYFQTGTVPASHWHGTCYCRNWLDPNAAFLLRMIVPAASLSAGMIAPHALLNSMSASSLCSAAFSYQQTEYYAGQLPSVIRESQMYFERYSKSGCINGCDNGKCHGCTLWYMQQGDLYRVYRSTRRHKRACACLLCWQLQDRIKLASCRSKSMLVQLCQLTRPGESSHACTVLE